MDQLKNVDNAICSRTSVVDNLHFWLILDNSRASMRAPLRCHQMCPPLARARSLDFSYCFAVRAALKSKIAAVAAHGGDTAFGQHVPVVATGPARLWLFYVWNMFRHKNVNRAFSCDCAFWNSI